MLLLKRSSLLFFGSFETCTEGLGECVFDFDVDFDVPWGSVDVFRDDISIGEVQLPCCVNNGFQLEFDSLLFEVVNPLLDVVDLLSVIVEGFLEDCLSDVHSFVVVCDARGVFDVEEPFDRFVIEEFNKESTLHFLFEYSYVFNSVAISEGGVKGAVFGDGVSV